MNRTLILNILFFMIIACKSEPIREFNVLGLHGKKSTLILSQDSTYIQVFDMKEKTINETGKWKGSFKPDSILITYIELKNGSVLSSSKYINKKDTLKLIEWSIQ